MAALGLLFTSMLSVQIGAAVATSLFDEIGVAATVALRIALAVPILFLIWPPRSLPLARRDRLVPILLGLTLAGMNFSFYAAIDRIPLGIAVTFEFLGPLAVAVATATRRVMVVWVGLAAVGIVALAGPIGDPLDGTGVALAVLAGAFWGAYILLTARLGAVFETGGGLTIAMFVAALATLPAGIATAESSLLALEVLGVGLAVALLASVITYSAELEALRRISAGLFGVLMSLEPAIAALVGLVALGQGLSAIEALGISCIVVASAGAIRTGRPPPPVGA